MTATAVMMRSCARISQIRVVNFLVRIIVGTASRPRLPHQYRPLARRATLVSRRSRVADRERLVDGRKHLPRRQFIQAPAVTLEMAFAAELAARQARQRILHDPCVAAP